MEKMTHADNPDTSFESLSKFPVITHAQEASHSVFRLGTAFEMSIGHVEGICPDVQISTLKPVNLEIK